MQAVINGSVAEAVPSKNGQKTYLRIHDDDAKDYIQIGVPVQFALPVGSSGKLVFTGFYAGAGQYGAYYGARGVQVEKNGQKPEKA